MMVLYVDRNTRISLDLLAEKLSEESLLDLLANNLDDNFVLLVLKYNGAILRYAESMVSGYDDAQEIRQLTFYKAYLAMKAMSIYSTDHIRLLPLKHWLYVIAKHSAYNLIKYKQRNAPFEQITEENEREDDERERPEERLMAAEGAQSVCGYIEQLVQLPKVHRDLLKVHLFFRVSYKDLAELSGIPLGTIKPYLVRGKRLLREIIEQNRRIEEGQ